MDIYNAIGDIARKRIAKNEQQIRHSVECQRRGRRVEAEVEEDRQEAAIERNQRVPAQVAKMMIDAVPVAEEALKLKPSATHMAPAAEALEGAEAVKGVADFVPIAYMERGLQVSRAVARITTIHRRAVGTGFLSSNHLLVTNHHVIPDPAHALAFIAEFNYEVGLDGSEKTVSSFRLDPDRFFITDGIDGLDVTVVAIGEQVRGQIPATAFGWCGLSDSGTKHALGDYVTIVQHPAGRHKEVVLRENLIAGRHEVALHYVADTEPGSSGSPVFNSDWQPVALHHWGTVHRWQGSGYMPNTVNEGIRISRIVRLMRDAQPSLSAAQSALLSEMLQKGVQGFPESVLEPPVVAQPVTTGARQASTAAPAATGRINERGGVTWTVPLEVSVNLPGLAPAAPEPVPSPPVVPTGAHERTPSPRTGYRPDFIDGFIVPLPQMTSAQVKKIARIRPERVAPGENDRELRYEHFSIVMNGERRLAYFTAVNIHGESLVGYSRKTKDFYDYTAASTAFAEALMGAESDSWADDDRIDTDEQTGDAFYKSTPNRLVKANGHKNLDPTPNFDRGHLVKRLDPCWGAKDRAVIAERDTFNWTNAAPQTSAFNQGKAKKLLGEREGRLWQGIENYILRNAWAMDTKVSTFTGPVFHAKDPVYSDKLGNLEIQVPLKFWKVIVWSEDGDLKSLALVADQTRTMVKKTAQEKLLDEDQLKLMEQFLTTVAKVEEMTGFEFGEAVSLADVRRGKKDQPDTEAESIA